jgi:ABC-type branched-subunit amino acid transport system substrate-binding protein
MEIHCTRIGCAQPLNVFPELEDSALLKTVPQRHCHHCGMHLILDGRYIPFQRIRQGGFGSVFLAYDRRTPTMKRCIVKQLQFNTSFTPGQVATATALFHREAEVLESLGEHPRIPRFFAFLEIDAEEFSSAVPQRMLYLVQEYIEGQDLQRELQDKGKLTEAEVRQVLQEVLEILDFMHSRNVIHRDIKPSNIVRDLSGRLHLIDFGAVKQIISTATTIAQLPALGVTGICTPEYAPAEQRQCHAIYPSSDLYALGVTCLHLLSGEHPPSLFDFRNHTWLWEKVAIDQQSQFFLVLQRMVKEVPVDRFQSARAALVALNGSNNLGNGVGNNEATIIPLDTRPQQSPSRFSIPVNRRLIAGCLAVAGGLMATGLCTFNLMKPNATGSFGNYSLLKAEGNNSPEFQKFKVEGLAAFRQKNYPAAVQNFRAALTRNPNAPETRIFLNNALVGNQPSRTIAVSIPVNEEESNYRALEMLRGFAHAQQNLNTNSKAKIKLEIFDDHDKKELAELIAKNLVDRSDILGIVGHNSSGVSLAAAEIYNSRQLPFITPMSISSQLTGNNKPYVFRTNVRGESVAQELASFMLNKSKKKKAAIFYVPKSPYSEELQAQFSRKLVSAGGEIVESFDLTNPSTISKNLNRAIAKKAEVIVLFPTHKYRKNAWAVLRNRQEQHPNTVVFGDIATLYSFETLNEARGAAQGMMLGVSWHIDEKDMPFSRESRNIWQSNVNWATATSYNALQAMGTAIQSDPKPARTTVRNLLSSMKFNGAAGDFQFFNGEPNERVTLVKVEKTDVNRRYSSGTGYDFVPMNPIVSTSLISAAEAQILPQPLN